ncbi:MAG: signal peptide peptidase SppA [Tepidisphaerales bacterium]
MRKIALSGIFLVLCVAVGHAQVDAPAAGPAQNDPVNKAAAPAPRAVPRSDKAAPATQPTTRSSKNVAQEIINKFREEKNKEKDQAKIAFIDLSEPVTETPPQFVLLADRSVTVHSVLDLLQQARRDPEIRGVLVNMALTDMNLAQAQEIRDALVEVKRAGKKAFVFADAYDTPLYIAASGASDICMMPGGEIEIPGVGLQTMFYRGLFDKVGVKPDFVQIGAYKGAEEPYTRTEPSKESRGELNKVVDSLYEQIVEGIAYHRHVKRADVLDVINGVFLSARVAKDRKFIDHLVDQDGLREVMKKEIGRDVNIVADYGREPAEELDFSNPLGLLKSLNKKAPEERVPGVALIYAEGDIVDGETESLFGGGSIGSENIRKAFRLAVRDEKIKAIVLRIDSPGGSAMASEVMWQAVRRAAEKKPVIISVGSMAASGGYYLASAGEYIFADSCAIVGSIGVVGGKFVLTDLFKTIGVHTEIFKRGENAALYTMDAPFTDSQRKLVTEWMQQTYEQFTARVMTTRKGKIKDIDEVAHGRIFLAKQARGLGMVDELGGLEKALAYAAKQGKLPETDFDVRVIPGTRTLADLLRGRGFDSKTPIKTGLTPDIAGLLSGLSPDNARLFSQQLRLMRMLQTRPVVLMSPFIVTTK